MALETLDLSEATAEPSSPGEEEEEPAEVMTTSFSLEKSVSELTSLADLRDSSSLTSSAFRCTVVVEGSSPCC